MYTRGALVVVVAVLIFAAASCSTDDKAESGATSTAANTTAATGTTVNTTATTDVTETSSSSTTSQLSIPPVTPPAGQPAACSLLTETELYVVDVPNGTMGVASDQPDGVPAPSTGCRWASNPGVAIALYYGRDPLEVLAVARQNSPGGIDVAGLGQDAYYVTGVLFVDTGSQAFAVSGGPTQSQLQYLARNALGRL